MFGLTAIECFVAIIVIFIITYWITPRKAAWIPMLLTTILLSVLAFNITPNETDDLNRYFTQLNYLRDYGKEYFDRCVETNDNGSNWGTYRVCGYYFYFLSKLPYNNYMPAITIFIVYGLMFLVIYKAANRFEVEKPQLFLGIMFFLSTYWYYDTLAGVRNGLAFAVVFACAYYHLVERKNIVLCLAGYVMACLMHSAAIMPVSLVLLTIITLNNSGRFLKYLLIFGLAAGGPLIQFISSRTSNTFVQSIAGRAEDHAAGSSSGTGINFYVNVVVFFIVAIVILYVTPYLTECKYTKELNRFVKYSSIITYFTIGCLFSSLIFLRFARWLIPVVGTLMYMIGMQMQKQLIVEKGFSYLKYYAPTNHSYRIKLKGLFNIIFIVFTAVHFWYLINGSSIHWMHF